MSTTYLKSAPRRISRIYKKKQSINLQRFLSGYTSSKLFHLHNTTARHPEIAKITFSTFLRSFFSSSRNHNIMASEAKAKVESLINEKPVIVFSKSWCTFSKASKRLLTSLGAEYEVVELDELDDGEEIQNALADITGQRTVPNIFIDHKHIGGHSDLQATKDLKQLLQQAKAL